MELQVEACMWLRQIHQYFRLLKSTDSWHCLWHKPVEKTLHIRLFVFSPLVGREEGVRGGRRRGWGWEQWEGKGLDYWPRQNLSILAETWFAQLTSLSTHRWESGLTAIVYFFVISTSNITQLSKFCPVQFSSTFSFSLVRRGRRFGRIVNCKRVKACQTSD